MPSQDVELQSVDGEFQQYGNLIVPPDRQPTRIGVDIVTRMLIGINLPANAVVSDAFTVGNTKETGSIPRLSLNLQRSTSKTLLEQVYLAIAEGKAPVRDVETEG